ncbi:hypothetical protein FHW67_003739 [Herbaspirillum sp. Sphag1AN]|uniref:hypothetical protein n=1 Tax=unclassified Herbaspirillum TaxID=2624150 RepID=UPI0016161511|nr:MULTISPECIES: hypothetical protein [unclassified Herbaspirillum]MBB3214422.1 hypothetical protein [Herbaspirillum sp. Sphag1AN]MBB3247474.1 hypothetical protein [Herbaspirillum sp. Sphag64]
MRGGGAGDIATLPGEGRTCQILLGVAHAGLGNSKNAIRQLLQEEQEILAQPIDFDWYRLLFLEWGLSNAHLMQGDLSNARFRAAKFVERAQATDEMCWCALAWEMSSRIAMLGEEDDLALNSIMRAIDTVESRHVPLAAWRVYHTAATIYAKRGDMAQAHKYAERFSLAHQSLIESLPEQHQSRHTLGGLHLDITSA